MVRFIASQILKSYKLSRYKYKLCSLSNLKNKVSEGQLTKDSKENNPSKISDYKFDGTETLLYQNRGNLDL